MKLKKWMGLAWGSVLVLLIADSSCALRGANAGLELCIRSVIPALFPFLVIGPMFTSSLGQNGGAFLRPLGRLFRIPQGCEGLLITGFLGGYPVGARCIAQAVSQGQVSAAQGKRLMAYCCNCGPGFLFGICSQFFETRLLLLAIWLIHMLSSLLVAMTIPPAPGCGRTNSKPLSLTEAMNGAINAMGQICGWVIFFRMALTFLEKWLLYRLGPGLSAVIAGAMELTNGCFALSGLTNPWVRFVLCEGMLTFGGLCVVLQTIAVTGSMGLGLYLPGKALQTVFSLLLAGIFALWMNGKWAEGLLLTGILVGFFLTLGLFREKYKKICGNPRPLGV